MMATLMWQSGIVPLFRLIDRTVRSSVQSDWMEKRLKNLPFFRQLCVGECRPHIISKGGRSVKVYADTTFLVVIGSKDQFIGLVGFDLEGESLLVSQMQGIKGVNLKGLNLAEYLLTCAEEIARVLRLNKIKVKPAKFNYYYYLDEDHFLYPQLYRHQGRLHKMYDVTPFNRGYEPTDDMRWREKRLS